MPNTLDPVKPVCLLAFVALLAALAGPLRAAQAARPNIILVLPDDVGVGDYACLGNPLIHTPTVDAFKKQSLAFTQFHVSPTCAPCRSALMSGRHEFKNGVTHTILERERMSLKTFTLAQLLQSTGYSTGIFGKWHLGDEEAYRPEHRGFDEVYIHGGGGIGQTFPGSCGDAPGNTNIDPALWHNGKFEKTTGYCTDLFFAQSIAWMDAKRTAHQPFFAYLSLNAAHKPLVVPEAYYKHYVGQPGVSLAAAKFFGMIENIDANFGVLLAKLEAWGIADNTLIIFFTGDNGGTVGTEIFNGGLRGSKGSTYQGGTRATAFFRWPGGKIPADVECAALSAHLDLFPTLAEITGAKLSADVRRQVEGRSLWPLLINPQAEWPDRTLVHHAGRWPEGKAADSKYKNAAIQNSRFTLVKNSELYDLTADPGEKTNVITRHPDVVAKLRASYDQWWSEVQPLLVNEHVTDAPSINPFHELYYKQFGGDPGPEARKRRAPNKAAGGEDDEDPPTRRAAPKKPPESVAKPTNK
ncbi:MAG: Arylsulfatase [Verrucomicrobiota bacterium]